MKRLAALLMLLLFLCVSALAQTDSDAYASIQKWRGDDGAFSIGDPEAPFKLIEFADFLCPHCQRYAPVIANFIDELVAAGAARFEYRLFPVVDRALSPFSARLAQCADTLTPGAFWQAHDLLYQMASQNNISAESAAAFASALDLDESALEACVATARQYEIDTQYGISLGVTGTPAIFAQYADGPPLAIAPASPDQLRALAQAIRPASTAPQTIKSGHYADLQTFRREDGGFVLGSPDTPLTIVAFEDFLCPHCQDYLATVHGFIDAHVRSGAANFEYRFYPAVDPQLSLQGAQIAECAGAQDLGLFWDAHDMLFDLASHPEREIDWASVISAELDLDAAALSDCLSRSVQYLVDIALAQKSQVRGTPAIRARSDNGELQIIHIQGQPMDRGAPPLEVLSALAEGSRDVTVGLPAPSILNSAYLHDDSLVTGEPCAPPCWQNIIPGETSLDDAYQILAARQFNPLQMSADGILFGRDGNPCCQIHSDDGELASAILLQLAPRILLGDVIALHGEPAWVTGLPFSADEHVLVLLYPESGLFVYAFVAGADGLLEAISPIVTALYTTPEELLSVVASIPLDRWKGYLPYSDYMDGEFDRLPEAP